MQPFVSPKIELSDERQERVDVRVLPVIFKVEKPKDLNLYPGELVDVYIGDKRWGILPAGPGLSEQTARSEARHPRDEVGFGRTVHRIAHR